MKSFNSAQLKAIQAPLAHMAINAAAGTGKTSTLAARIHYIQTEMDILPNSIIAISFSRTARSRLIEKLKELCKETGSGSPVPTYTFHGLSFRILRLASWLGETWLKPGFEILDTTSIMTNPIYKKRDSLLSGIGNELDQTTALIAYMKAIDILRQGTGELSPNFRPEQLMINKTLKVEVEQNTWITVKSIDIAKFWSRYQRMLKQLNVIDYTGMIVEAIQILSQSDSETRKRIVGSLRAIVVDEYQDTSRAQADLLFALSGTDIPINIVGDIDQTIYSFNGSSATNMIDFISRAAKTDVPVLPTIGMTENYRSANPILELANRIRSDLLVDRTLVPASEIMDATLSSYRDLNAPVQLVYAPRLELAADFVANEINKLVTKEKIKNIAVLVRKDTEHSPQALVVKDALSLVGIKSDTIVSKNHKGRQADWQFLYDLFQDPEHYGKTLLELQPSTTMMNLPETMTIEDFNEYIQEAIDSGAKYCYEATEFIFDNMNADISKEGTDVQIGTVHSSKGEEFRVVFLLYLGDRSFPHGSKPDLDEERRLLYVGITRAQERLYVVGRPGVLSEDFFGNCKGSFTEYSEYTVPGGISLEAFDPDFDENVAASIEQARAKQLTKEIEDRERLWELFEEEEF